MKNQYQTPEKFNQDHGDGVSTIAHGITDRKQAIKLNFDSAEKSQVFYNNRNNDEKQLSSIQEKIEQIGHELSALYKQMKQLEKQKDGKFTIQYLQLESQRNKLRKDLIQLDFKHKRINYPIMRQKLQRQQEQRKKIKQEFQQRQKIRKVQNEQRQKRRQQQNRKYSKEYNEKLQALLKQVQSKELRKIEEPSEENQFRHQYNGKEDQKEMYEKQQKPTVPHFVNSKIDFGLTFTQKSNIPQLSHHQKVTFVEQPSRKLDHKEAQKYQPQNHARKSLYTGFSENQIQLMRRAQRQKLLYKERMISYANQPIFRLRQNKIRQQYERKRAAVLYSPYPYY